MNKEVIAKLLESGSREDLREVIKSQTGEYNELDFKEEWPTPEKIAKHILAFSNYGGGCMIVGVSEKNKSIEPIGLPEFKKKEDLFSGIEGFLPTEIAQSIEIADYGYEESEYPVLIGKKFQVLFVNGTYHKAPFVSKKDGENIKKNRIYIRRGVKSVEASYEEIQQIISKRIDTGYSTTSEMELEAHLNQLKILYDHIDRYNVRSSFFEAISSSVRMSLGTTREKNPSFPPEDYEGFINRAINKKKRRIELEIDVLGLNE